MEKIYFIGGSPCAGKSTVAEIISKKYGMFYFAVDKFLDGYTKKGAQKGYPICKKQMEMRAEEIWMRDPLLQCNEEFQYYREVMEFIIDDLKQIRCENGIITEGAAYAPKIIGELRIPKSRYLSITPTREFQISHFRKRKFVPCVLDGCSDLEGAFQNWMGRDVLFAQEVRLQCEKEGYCSVVNDGSKTIEVMADLVTAHFGLNTE